MAYLFGDSTPFPLDENYIETMRDATRVCTELLRADQVIEDVRIRVTEEEVRIEREKAGLKRVANDLAESLEPHASEGATPTVREMSSRLVETIRGVLDGTHHTLTMQLDALAKEAHSRVVAERAGIPRALERFLLRHDLAETTWSVSWTLEQDEAMQTPAAQAISTSRMGLAASFELALAPTAKFARGVRVGELRPGLEIELPKKAGWLGRGSGTRRVEFDRYIITAAALTPMKVKLTARKAQKGGAPGFVVECMLDDKHHETISIWPVDDPAMPKERFVVEGPTAEQVAELRVEVQRQLFPLADQRARLMDVALDGTPVGELENPAILARMLIRDVAPLVREIKRRSSVPGELALKREVQDGRREEIFVSVRSITEIYSGLRADRRALFDEFGLEGGAPGAPDEAQPGLGREAPPRTPPQARRQPTGQLYPAQGPAKPREADPAAKPRAPEPGPPKRGGPGAEGNPARISSVGEPKVEISPSLVIAADHLFDVHEDELPADEEPTNVRRSEAAAAAQLKQNANDPSSVSDGGPSRGDETLRRTDVPDEAAPATGGTAERTEDSFGTRLLEELSGNKPN